MNPLKLLNFNFHLFMQDHPSPSNLDEEIVNQILNNSLSISDFINKEINQSKLTDSHLSNIIAKLISKAPDEGSSELLGKINQIINSLPSLTIYSILLEQYPEAFIYILINEPNEQKAQSIVSSVSANLNLLSKAFAYMWTNSFSNEERHQFYRCILKHLAVSKKSLFLNDLVLNLDINCIEFLLSDLTEEDIHLCIQYFYTCYSCNQLEESFKTLIECLTAFRRDLTSLQSFALKEILNALDLSYDEKDGSKVISNIFHTLSTISQVHLLKVMPLAQRKGILEHQNTDMNSMVNWLETFLSCNNSYESNCEFVSYILTSISDEDFIEFLHNLNKLDSSLLIPYLLFHLPIHLLYQFMFLEHQDEIAVSEMGYNGMVDLRTQLLNKCQINAATCQLIGTISEQHESWDLIYQNMIIDMAFNKSEAEVFSKDMLNSNFSLKGICSDINSWLIAMDDDPLSASYQTFIRKIPPILVGIASCDPDNYQMFLKITFYLDNKQIQAFVAKWLSKDVFNHLELLSSHLRKDQIHAIFKSLSISQLEDYIFSKEKQLDEAEIKYLLIHEQLQKELKLLKQLMRKRKHSKAEKVGNDYLEKLWLQVFQLQVIVRQLASPELADLLNIIEEQAKQSSCLENAHEKIKQLYQQFKLKLNDKSLSNQLSLLEKDFSLEDQIDS